MDDNVPAEIQDDLRNLSEDELEFIEQEMFLAYDEAYRAYYINDINTKDEIAMYERALETIRTIRGMKETLSEHQMRQAKDIHGSINDIE